MILEDISQKRQGLVFAMSVQPLFFKCLKRALETASLILDEGSSKVPIIMDKRLKEIAFGEWEGKSVARNQMEVPDEFLKFYDDPEHFAGAPGGESFAEVKERTDDFLKWLVGQEEYEDKNILLVTHGVALATLLNNIKKAPLSELWLAAFIKTAQSTEARNQRRRNADTVQKIRYITKMRCRIGRGRIV